MIKAEKLEQLKDTILKEIQDTKGFGKSYFDFRIEVIEGKGAGAQNGNSLGAEEDSYAFCGTRCITDFNGVKAQGFASKTIGVKEAEILRKVLKELKEDSFKRAKHNAELKKKLKKKYEKLARNLCSTETGDAKQYLDKIEIKSEKKPEDTSLEELIERTKNASKNPENLKEVKTIAVSGSTGIERKVFANSVGSLIDHITPHSSGFVYVSAFGKGAADYYASIGAYKGTEVLDGSNEFEKTLEEFAEFLAKGTAELSNAPTAKASQKDVTVVTDPWYNSLVVHEICGHPSEADRALKREAAWAGRAWWFHSMEENMFQKQVASEKVSVFSDPTMEGYGNYKYDDEGTLGKKVYNIKQGNLNEFLNSKETAQILGKEPNGSARAATAADVPIIRMNNTCFEGGDWKPEEIIQETKEGYYLYGHRIPSIGDTRQNFRITCWKLYEIKNGEIRQLYRNGGMTSDSAKYLKSIDATGKDFKIFNIPNCGKGTPMQTMRVGNGGPTMRGTARITGAE